MRNIKCIVLTGGPCGGKTSAISRICRKMLEMGWYVLVIPETATELIPNGIRPFASSLTPFDFQKIVIKKQMFKEDMYKEVSYLVPNNNVLIICDRGLMDSKSYVDLETFDKLLKKFDLTEAEIMSRYDAVIHLVSAAKGAEKYYTLGNNEARSETKEEAAKLDDLTLNSWVGHRNLKIVDNSTGFDEKLDRVIKEICATVGTSIPTVQKKYLVKLPNIEKLKDAYKCNICNILQMYLEIPEGIYINVNHFEKKVMVYTYDGNKSYYLVEKNWHVPHECIKSEKRLSKEEFDEIISDNSVSSICASIEKERISFVHNNQYFNLDIFQFSEREGYAILEVNLADDVKKVDIPNIIKVIKEVTDDTSYKNFNLAKARRFTLI